MLRSTLLVTAGVLAGLAAAPIAHSVLSPAAVLADEKIVVIEHATSDAVLDLGDAGDSAGDVLTFSNDVYDADDANKVGTDIGSCTRIMPGKAWHCNWTVTLDDGQIDVNGPFYDADDSTLAIIGGTGAYADVSGEMKLEDLGNGEKYRFTFDID